MRFALDGFKPIDTGMSLSITGMLEIHYLAFKLKTFEGHGSTTRRLYFDMDNRGGWFVGVSVKVTRHIYLL
jgi:hypothetical protein